MIFFLALIFSTKESACVRVGGGGGEEGRGAGQANTQDPPLLYM